MEGRGWEMRGPGSETAPWGGWGRGEEAERDLEGSCRRVKTKKQSKDSEEGSPSDFDSTD